MARATIEVIRALRLTADKLEKGSSFQWGHMGSCNCGNLAQTVTHFTKEEIHAYALEKRGNWSDQLIDYCPTSGYPMDMIIAKMIEIGFTLDDLGHLEWLSDRKVVERIGPNTKLYRNDRADVVKYMRTWAVLLEEEWMQTQQTPQIASLEFAR
jgi:hypothetical protein